MLFCECLQGFCSAFIGLFAFFLLIYSGSSLTLEMIYVQIYILQLSSSKTETFHFMFLKLPFKNLFFYLKLIYYVMLVSGVQQSDSDFFFIYFSIIGYYEILSTVPCAIQ